MIELLSDHMKIPANASDNNVDIWQNMLTLIQQFYKCTSYFEYSMDAELVCKSIVIRNGKIVCIHGPHLAEF